MISDVWKPGQRRYIKEVSAVGSERFQCCKWRCGWVFEESAGYTCLVLSLFWESTCSQAGVRVLNDEPLVWNVWLLLCYVIANFFYVVIRWQYSEISYFTYWDKKLLLLMAGSYSVFLLQINAVLLLLPLSATAKINQNPYLNACRDRNI